MTPLCPHPNQATTPSWATTPPRAAPSGGEWRRVQLARALATPPHAAPPQLVLLDEPTLLMSDEEAWGFMARLRRTLREEWGAAAGSSPPVVVIASQRPSLAAFADQVAILDGGRVLQYGSPQQVVPSALLGGGGSGRQPQQPQSQGQQRGRPQPQAAASRQHQQQQQPAAGYGLASSSPPAAKTAAPAALPPPRTRGVRWGGGSITSNSDNEDEVYLFEREG